MLRHPVHLPRFADFSALSDDEVQRLRQTDSVLPIKWYFTGGVSYFDGVDARNSDFHGAIFTGAALDRTDFTFARLGGAPSTLLAQAGEHFWWQLRYVISGGAHALAEWSSSASADSARDPRAVFVDASLAGVRIELGTAVDVGLSPAQMEECLIISHLRQVQRKPHSSSQ